MIIWNEALQQHDIRIKGNVRAHLNKYLNGGETYPNKNVTVEQAEGVVADYIYPLIFDDGYHSYIHIFSFGRNTIR